jgi:hypothetical protein
MRGRVLAAFHGWRHPARARPTLIVEVVDGTSCVIRGTVVRLPDTELLVSPITGQSCVYYRALVTRGTEPPILVMSEERRAAFGLVDDSGRAVIDPAGAILELDERRTGVALTPRPELVEDLRAHHAREWSGRLRFSERVIGPGDQLIIAGHALREPDPDPRQADAGYRGGATRLRLGGSRHAPLVLRDPPEAPTLS